MKRIFFAGISSLFCLHAVASTPVFVVTPNIPAPSTVYNGEPATAVYQVTNTSPYNLTNVGLAQMPSGAIANTNSVSAFSNYCTNPFSLNVGSSCLVKVQLNTNQLGAGVNSGPIICFSQSKPIYCSQPLQQDQMQMAILQSPIPQDCNSNVANFNYELAQSLDSATLFVPGWGPGRNPLLLSPINPNLTSCPTTAGISWKQQRIVAAAAYWIARKLNYCHHYNPDYATPISGRGAAGNAGGYCNPAVDSMPGSVYYGQQARWNYSGTGSETQNNWVNNNQMWYGMDCSNYTAFLYNFAFGPNTTLGIPFDSQTGYQAGQISGGSQDTLSPNQQVNGNPALTLNNPNEAGKLVCKDGTVDPTPSTPTMCTGHGGYLSAIDSSGSFHYGSVTVAAVAQVLQPGDILFIAGGGPNPDGSGSIVTHAIMWLGLQVGTGPNNINPALVAPNDAPCANPSIWQPNTGDWLISDSHYQGADYRVLTSCFYLNNLWGVRRVIQ
jgi:hypothetical protein